MRAFHAFALVTFTLALGLGCTMHYDVAASAAAVGADAKIDATEEKEQGLTRLTLRVENLAPADRVSNGATSFVAWQKAGDAGWLRIGALKYDEGGRFALLDKATVPALGFDLQVTAESGPSPTAPSNVVIISQKIGG